MPELCPTPERLAAALLSNWEGERPREPGGDAELAAHLADCPACQAKLEALAGGSGWLEAKARTHAGTTSESLRQAMLALESRGASSESEAPSPPPLDFLRPSDQPGVLGRFGPYEVIEHVASGGMGIVLKARDPALDRIVALKILPPALAANALARARFVREARAAAAVVHDNVVPIHAVDECAGLPYLVMQFVKGRTLAERIRATGPLRLEEVLRIGAQAAAGLAAAHAQGLIHRDVKPGNILLENSIERVKLTDFGLARAVEDVALTRTGEVAGTPAFMAPEQAGNELVDHRADLFSLGSVLYAMCTGRSPFQGNSVLALIRKVCDEQPPAVHELNAAIPRWLSDIIARLMAKAPDGRFQSAREIGELLEGYLARVQRGELGEAPGTSLRPKTASRVGRWAAIGTAASLAVLALWVFVLKDRRGSLPGEGTTKRPTAGQEAFIVRTEAGATVGGFRRIEDAIAAAPARAVIELCWNGSRDVDAIRLPAKPLTLRAGRGFQPVWNSPESAPGLSASAALTLEGIRFDMTSRTTRPRPGGFHPQRPRVPPSGLALLSITNGPLLVTHCVLDPKGGGGPEWACIFLANVSTCRLDNTLVFARMAKAIVWQQQPGLKTESASGVSQITMTNCIAVGAEAFWLDLQGFSRAGLEITRCTVHAPTTFYVPASQATTRLEVNAHQNVFDTGSVILDARNPASPPLPQWLHWREQGNLYRRQQRPDERYIAGIAAGPATLADWNRWWNQTAANSREVQIEFANGMKAGYDGRLFPEPGGFRITDLHVVEGPPLERDQWQFFGADTGNVGPRPVK